MRVEIRLFANVKEIAGQDKLALELPESATAGDVVRLLSETYPRLHDALKHVLVAVNMELADPSRPVREGDEVALIPPVGGGETVNPYVRLSADPLDVEAAHAQQRAER